MIDIANLSREERLALLERLWQSLSENPASIPVTETQKVELDLRLAEMDSDPKGGIPAVEVLDRLGAKRH